MGAETAGGPGCEVGAAGGPPGSRHRLEAFPSGRADDPEENLPDAFLGMCMCLLQVLWGPSVGQGTESARHGFGLAPSSPISGSRPPPRPLTSPPHTCCSFLRITF